MGARNLPKDRRRNRVCIERIEPGLPVSLGTLVAVGAGIVHKNVERAEMLDSSIDQRLAWTERLKPEVERLQQLAAGSVSESA